EGFTTIDNLYVRNGTYFIVTNDVHAFPRREQIIAYIPAKYGVDGSSSDGPKELQFLTLEEAQSRIGDKVLKVSGFSVIIDDDEQFMTHYYHWWGEIILGFWRVFSSLRAESEVSLPPPERFIIPYVDELKWRDRPGVNAILMRAAFPLSSIESQEYWGDFKRLDTTVMFERAMIVSRPSRFVLPYTMYLYTHDSSMSAKFGKMIGSTLDLKPPDHFWEDLRQRTIKNALGFVPQLNLQGVVESPEAQATVLPMVMYISRQDTGRRLNDAAHEDLVDAMEKLEDEGVCIFVLAQMEYMSLQEQIELASKSTVIIGVHGNGLTHQLWMKPSPRSAVFEIMYPKGDVNGDVFKCFTAYVYDYEMLSRNMDHKHYAVWNDTLVTYPKG
ncbi:hypothetical protein BDQ17DRAFT_1226488, partial [Cyathus striatus]